MGVGTEMGNELMDGFHISTIHDTTEYILMYNIGKEVKYITILWRQRAFLQKLRIKKGPTDGNALLLFIYFLKKSKNNLQKIFC